ncbi:dynein axonemal heavy chain 1-like isoform X2 [Hydractinia symbiolongicarpus]|uniref:dynein axonemal heavy chain 1-like isoform X2 n=1 Tax=Hydractinia symbiolongicarpus TaxID=13093 RepID=UPI00254C2A9E|nr:dynein axonemal heavy chain 1-like isoform X2 [Hydractinia symbiolongicarpus]
MAMLYEEQTTDQTSGCTSQRQLGSLLSTPLKQNENLHEDLNINYLKDTFVKSCIQALQSEIFGPWIHLTEVLNLIKPVSRVLLTSKQVVYYVHRIYNYCKQHEDVNELNIVPLLTEVFVDVNFTISNFKSIDAINSQGSDTLTKDAPLLPEISESRVRVHKDAYFSGSDPTALFAILPDDLRERIYEPRSLNITDLQKYLPQVVSDITKLESTWDNALGLTLISLNTNIPQTILPDISTIESTVSHSTLREEKRKIKKIVAPKTGREVVESLVKSTNENVIKIWYLNFIPTKLYEPYSLVVASKKTVKKEHAVISIFGVLYVNLNGYSELTPLGQWYMEAVLFHNIRHISFFRNFLLIKVFQMWRRNIKYQQFCKIQKKIRLSTLLNIPSVPTSLLKVKQLLLQLEKLSFFPNFEEGGVSVNVFRKRLKDQFDSCCKYILKLFNISEEIIKSCHSDCQNYNAYCQAQLKCADRSAKESMTITRKRQDFQTKNKKTAQYNLDRFHLFQKLVYSMIFSRLTCILSTQFQCFVNRDLLQNKKGCLYITTVVTNLKQVSFQPEVEQLHQLIIEAFKNVLLELQATINNQFHSEEVIKCEEKHKENDARLKVDEILQILDERSDSTLTSSNAKHIDVQFHNIVEVILAQKIVENSIEELKERLAVAGDDAEIFLSSLCWLGEIIGFVSEWEGGNFNDWKTKSTLLVEKHMLKLKSWSAQIERMATSYVTPNGLLFIDCLSVQQMLLPRLQEIFENIVKVLSEDYRIQAKMFISQLQCITKNLSVPSLEVDKFAKFYVYVKDIKKQLFEFNQKMDYLKATSDVIKHCYCQLSLEEEETEKQLLVTWEAFIFSVQTGQDYISEHSPAVTKKLKKDIVKMIAEALEMVNKATTGKFIDEMQQCSYVLKDLRQLFDDFKSREKEIVLYSNCQQMINGETTDLVQLELAEKKIKSRFELWKYLDLTIQTINEWKFTSFKHSQLNIKKVSEKVQQWNKASLTIEASIPANDKVFAMWKEVIKDFQQKLIVLQELAIPALKIHHWKEIFVILGNAYDDSVTYNVSDIVSMSIWDNYDKIRKICMDATSECALENCLDCLIKEWEKRDFKLAKNVWSSSFFKGHQKDTVNVDYILTASDELLCQIEDSLVTLESMLVSPHVAGIRICVYEWVVMLQELKEIINMWTTAQQQWKYLGKMFSSSHTQSQYPVEYDAFIATNKIMKDLTDSIIKDSKVLHVLEQKIKSEGCRELQGEKLKVSLNDVIQKQSVVIKQLEEYLLTIQNSSPRLYFLSHGEMLKLLAINRNPKDVIPFVRKCFNGMTNLKFEMPQTSTTNIFSPIDISLNTHLLEVVALVGEYGEEVILEKKIPFSDSMEKWFKQLEQVMKETVWSNLFNCMKKYTALFSGKKYCLELQALKEMLFNEKISSQSIFLFHDALWSDLIQDVIHDKISKSNALIYIEKVLVDVTDFLKSSSLINGANVMDKRLFLLLQVLFLQLRNYQGQLQELDLSGEKSSFQNLMRLSTSITTSGNDLDFKTKNNFKVELKCLGHVLCYGYEYDSTLPRLVLTPHTDRCMLSLVTAFQDFKVGCLTGKSQDGKSETAHCLAKKLGRHFITLNCTMDTPLSCIVQMMYGALGVGSILCLDNAHFLSADLLSVIGQYFYNIFNALKCVAVSRENILQPKRCHSVADIYNIPNPSTSKHLNCNGAIDLPLVKPHTNENNHYMAPMLGNILFENRLVEVSSLYASVMVIKNEFDKWRSVPDNLREMLRPVSIHSISKKLLYEAWFVMNGFSHSVALAKKINIFLECLPEMNAHLLSVRKIGCIIDQTAQNLSESGFQSNDEEVFLAKNILAMLKVSLPTDVLQCITQKMKVIFPCMKYTSSSYSDTMLLKSVKHQIRADNLILKPEFLNKVLTLHDILSHSRSVILVGKAACGKTACYQTLSRALCQFYYPWLQSKDLPNKKISEKLERINVKVIYPNVFTTDQMYGHFDSNSTWIDGLFTKMVCSYKVLKNAALKADKQCEIQNWFVMNGNINNSWIIPFESLLNHSNEFVIGNIKKISVAEHAKVFFETDTLEAVSPALISRSTILHFHDDQVVDWKCVFDAWKTTAHNKFSLAGDELNAILNVLSYTLENVSKCMKEDCSNILSANNVHDVSTHSHSTVINCMQVLNVLSAVLTEWKSRDQHQSIDVDKESQNKFITHMVAYSMANALTPLVYDRSLAKLDICIRQIFSTCPICPVIFPCHILDCYFDGNIGELVPWNEHVLAVKTAVTSSFVLTREHQKIFHLSDMLLASGQNLMLIGEPGSGKSSFVKHAISTKYTTTKIQISKATSVEHFQSRLLVNARTFSQYQNNKKNLPKKSENVIVFVDDLNLSAQHGYCSDTPLSECMRQINMEGGVHDCNGKYFHHLPNTQFITTYSPPVTDFVGINSKSLLQPKLYRHFSILRMPSCTGDQMVRLFSQQCENWLERFSWLPFKQMIACVISKTAINLHQSIKDKFTWTNLVPQYVFSQHDVARVFKGLFLFSSNVDVINKSRTNHADVIKSSMNGRSELVHGDKEQNTDDKMTETLGSMVHLLCHEVQKVYGERLLHQTDYDWLMNRIQEEVNTLFGSEVTLQGIKTATSSSLQDSQLCSVLLKKSRHKCATLFNSYYITMPTDQSSNVFKCATRTEFKLMLYDAMKSVNETKVDNMELVFFDDMLRHAENLCRALNILGGHALLISQNGHGRKKIFRIVSKLLRREAVEVHFSSSKNNQIAAVKDACNMAGLKGQPVLLYASEFLTEETLMKLAALINDGYCPDLYSSSELLLICTEMLPGGLKTRKKGESYERAENRFFQRIKQNLHIVLCENQEGLRKLLNVYPVFLHKMFCVDVYKEWSNDVLQHISLKYLLKRSDSMQGVSRRDLKQVSNVAAKIHQTTREFTSKIFTEKGIEVYSPLKFFEFIDLFTRLFGLMTKRNMKRLQHVEKGVSRINEAKQAIVVMSSEIEELAPVIEVTKGVVKEAEREMKETKSSYTKIKNICQKQEEKIERLQVSCDELRNETNRDFNKLSPLYEAALAALSLLDYHAVDELRSYRAPPQGVKYVTDMLCVMFGVVPQWEEAKLLLMRDKFIQDLQFYDKDHISDAMYDKLSSFIQNPSSQCKELVKISHAANQLSVWIQAIYNYATILRELQPKKTALQDAEIAILQAEKELGAQKMKCSNMKEELESKIQHYKEKSKVLKSLQSQYQSLCKKKTHANSLLSTMQPFTDDWSKHITTCHSHMSSAIGDSILTAASVVYMGILTQVQQEELNQIWRDFFTTDGLLTRENNDMLLVDVLSSDEEQDDWLRAKEWTDVSTINHVLRIRTINLLCAKCCPLLIDPQDVGERWVKVIENGLCAQDLQDKDQYSVIRTTIFDKPVQEINKSIASMQNDIVPTNEEGISIFNADDLDIDEKLTSAMSSGRPVFVKHMERMKEGCMLSQFIHQYKTSVVGNVVTIGKRLFKCNPGFRLYLSASVTMEFLNKEKFLLPLHRTIPINLEFESCSLTGMLHQKVIRAEKPELETQIHRINLDVCFLRDERKSLQEQILNYVTSLPSKLLEQKNILDFMGFYQEKLLLTEEKYFECKTYLDNMMKEIKDYKTLAVYSANIYAILQKLSRVHHLYNFPVHAFMSVFDETLTQSHATKAAASNVLARAEEMKTSFTGIMFKRISMSIFLEHIFLFPLCIVLEKVKNHTAVTEEERCLFFTGFNFSIAESCAFDRPHWIQQESWKRFVHLSYTVPCFKNLLHSLTKRTHEWEEYFESIPMMVCPPSFEEVDMHKFHLALLWLAYDTSLLPVICENMILCHLGPDFLNLPTFDANQIISHSLSSMINIVVLPDNEKPVIQDPCLVLSRFADEQAASSVSVISIGEGEQIGHASRAIRTAAKRGGWVILQNCHLIKTWPRKFMKEIMKVFRYTTDELNTGSMKADTCRRFRIWMILRATGKEDGFILPDYICQNSRTFVWQYEKNTAKDIKSILRKSLDVSKSNRDMLVDVFQNEVYKNAVLLYSKQVKISSCDLDFSATLCNHLTQSYFKPSVSVVKDLVYLPQMSTSYDVSLLTKEIEEKRDMRNERSKITFEMLGKFYNINRQPSKLYNIDEIKKLYSHVRNMSTEKDTTRIALQGRYFITEHLRGEAKTYRNILQKFAHDVSLLENVMQGRLPWNAYLMSFHEKISSNCTPDAYKPKCAKKTTLSNFLDTLGTRLTYFNSLLDEFNVIAFDLSHFTNSQGFLSAVKLQYANDSDLTPEEIEWIGERVDSVPSNVTSIINGVYLQNLTLINTLATAATTNGQIAQPSAIIPFVQYKPRQTSDNVAVLDVYQSLGGQEESLFSVIQTSIEIMDESAFDQFLVVQHSSV